ncbi:SEL1-like repeat protein [Nocardiopsis sp. CNT-189]|uniref:tetratricopeptide repeat protein n=1 Tax=Nocardiopsis oceanisediminis TaxID=2816862 RepID=UPI003B316118
MKAGEGEVRHNRHHACASTIRYLGPPVVSNRAEMNTAGNLVQVGSLTGALHLGGGNGISPDRDRKVEAALAAALPVAHADLRNLGVRPARPGLNGSKLPPYVPRDHDGKLVEAVQEAARRGGAVLVRGDSAAGKTRSLVNALVQTVGFWPLISPPVGTDLGSLAEHIARTPAFAEEGAIVWLDNVDRFLLPGVGGLTETNLALLTCSRLIVAATLSTHLYEYHCAPHSLEAPDGAALYREHGNLMLKRLNFVTLDRRWSPEEIRRAAESGDERLNSAARVAEQGVHGVAEYLAAGPELLGLWRDADRPTSRNGHPRGYAVVAAAVDLTRTGLAAPLDRSVLETAHTAYLQRSAVFRPEDFDQALDWAQEVRLGVSGLLIPFDVGEDLWQPFEYLVEAAEGSVPEAVWRAALVHAADDDERMAIIGRAADEGQQGLAREACALLAQDGHPQAMNLMGCWLHEEGELRGAQRWYRRAAAMGNTIAMVNLALLLEGRGGKREAERWYRRAADAGEIPAMVGLGSLLYEWGGKRGSKREAERWYRRAADAGEIPAMVGLGFLLLQQRREKEAEWWFRCAAQKGDSESMVSFGDSLYRRGDKREAERWYRRAADAGEIPAMVGLGFLLLQQRREKEAEWWFRCAAQKGDHYARLHLGVLLRKQGRNKEAEEWFQD